MEALPLFLDDVDMLPICRLRQVAIKVSSMARNADCSRTLQNHFSVLIWSSCAKAPVSQLVEETASKSVQCGFESHRGHRIDEQPWLEISSHGFFFETHLAHVPLRGSSVPCHPPDCRLSPRPRHACQDRCVPNVILPLDVRLICRNAYAIIYRGFRHAFPCAGTRRCRLL